GWSDKARHGTERVAMADSLNGVGNRTVGDESRLVSTAMLDVPVESVVAGVDDTTREPAREGGSRGIEHAVPLLVPRHGFRRFRPEAFWIGEPPRIDHIVRPAHARPKLRAGARTRNGGRRPQSLRTLAGVSGTPGP